MKFQANLNTNFDKLETMDLEKDETSEDKSCSICLELVVVDGDRSIAKLHCGHNFHLDCIGSAFNAKGSMQCPNCRKVEKGRWLFANGQRSSGPDLDFDGWLPDEFYDLSYSELPFGFQWCPFRGITQLASLLEDQDSQLNSYLEPLNNTTYDNHPNTSSTTHVCPYMALHGPHGMHIAAPSSSRDSENIVFTRHHSNNLGGVQQQQQPSNDMMSFQRAEPQNQNWQQLQNSHTYNFLGNAAEQSSSQFGPRMSRDVANQPRSGPFVHPRPVVHGSGPHGRSSVAAPSMGGGGGGGEHTGHSAHPHSSSSFHMYQQHSAPSSSLRTPPFPPPPSSTELAGYYGFATVSSSASPGPHQYDHQFGWGRARERVSPPLPWIPLEGESQWWGPFNPSSGPPLGPRMPRSSYM